MTFNPVRSFQLLTLSLIILGAYACGHSHRVVKQRHTHRDTLEYYPYWIAMMDSPGVNYANAVHAFEVYWSHRERPTEPDGEARDIYGRDKSESERKKEQGRSIQYVEEYRRFLNWQQRNQNLVKPNGTLMTPDEIIEQWKKSQTDSTR